jgi:hypothetical protein
MIRFIKIFSLILVSITFLSGCVYKQPVDFDEKYEINPSLLGVWVRETDGKDVARLTFYGSGKEYLVFEAKGENYKLGLVYMVYEARKEGIDYLQAQIIDWSAGQTLSLGQDKVYRILRYSIHDEKLVLEHLIAEDNSNGTYRNEEDPWLDLKKNKWSNKAIFYRVD